jgi:hypothetical protein
VTFDPTAMIVALVSRGVDFVLIGGFAAVAHGYDGVTTDLDVTPSRDVENLVRLSAALRDLDARIRVDGIDGGLPFEHDASSLAGASVWNLVTRVGDLDLAMLPAGTDGYDDLVPNAVEVAISGVTIKVAALSDIIRSKAAANRPKDLLALPTLRAMHERYDQTEA